MSFLQRLEMCSPTDPPRMFCLSEWMQIAFWHSVCQSSRDIYGLPGGCQRTFENHHSLDAPGLFQQLADNQATRAYCHCGQASPSSSLINISLQTAPSQTRLDKPRAIIVVRDCGQIRMLIGESLEHTTGRMVECAARNGPQYWLWILCFERRGRPPVCDGSYPLERREPSSCNGNCGAVRGARGEQASSHHRCSSHRSNRVRCDTGCIFKKDDIDKTRQHTQSGCLPCKSPPDGSCIRPIVGCSAV